MRTTRPLWLLLPLALVACDEDSAFEPPPPPPTPDEQVIANCLAIRDAIEAYADAHNGDYPAGLYFWTDLGVYPRVNPYTGTNEPSTQHARFPGQIGLERYLVCDGSQRTAGYRITGRGRNRQLIHLEYAENVPANDRWIHDVVVANATLVASAADTWAAANLGEYPTDLADEGADGKTMIDLLPRGEWLVNPVTGVADQPLDGAPVDAGQIGYAAIGADDGTMTGYLIEGIGCEFLDGVTLVPESEFDMVTRNDCHTLRRALEQFAEAGSAYPRDLAADQTPGGQTVLDLLWHPLRNPYTDSVSGDPSNPVAGIADSRGEIGYAPIELGGVVTGYVITGYGLFEEIVRLGPRPLGQ